MRIYLAGPMQHHPECNFPAFLAAAKWLRRHGYRVVNPAEHDLKSYPDMMNDPAFKAGELSPTFDLAETLRWDFHEVLDCEGIVMLPGWESSGGARCERMLAELTKKVIYLLTGTDEDTYQLRTDAVYKRMAKPEVIA